MVKSNLASMSVDALLKGGGHGRLRQELAARIGQSMSLRFRSSFLLRERKLRRPPQRAALHSWMRFRAGQTAGLQGAGTNR